MFSKEYIKDLRCPFCKSNIYMSKGTIICQDCGKSFEIREGIPIFSEAGDASDMRVVRDYIEQLKSTPESEFIDITAHFLLPNHKYNLGVRCSANKSLKEFFRRFPNLNELRILNVSCGAGQEAQILIEKGVRNIYLLDVSFPAILYAKRCFEKFYPKHNLHYFVSDACHLPFSEEFFDIVLVYASAHHYHNFNLFLSEASRVSRNICLIAESCKMGTAQRIIDLIGWNIEYAKLNTARFDEKKLIKQFSQIGMKCETERIFQYYPGLLNIFGNYKFFVNTWFLFLKFLDMCLPKSWCHSINVYATK